MDVDLCVECRNCAKRAVLGKAQGLAIHSGNMDRLWRLKLRCTACGDNRPNLYVPSSRPAAAAFLDGAPIGSA